MAGRIVVVGDAAGLFTDESGKARTQAVLAGFERMASLAFAKYEFACGNIAADRRDRGRRCGTLLGRWSAQRGAAAMRSCDIAGAFAGACAETCAVFAGVGGGGELSSGLGMGASAAVGRLAGLVVML